MYFLSGQALPFGSSRACDAVLQGAMGNGARGTSQQLRVTFPAVTAALFLVVLTCGLGLASNATCVVACVIIVSYVTLSPCKQVG